jgi:hypothetical protein
MDGLDHMYKMFYNNVKPHLWNFQCVMTGSLVEYRVF